LPPVLAPVLPETEFELMRRKLLQLPESPDHARLHKDDWLGAAGAFLVVFFSTYRSHAISLLS